MGVQGNGSSKTMAGSGALVGAAATVSADGAGALIEPGSPLTRLRYFDGKLLRARDLELEQSYLRTLVALSNQAGGAGVVHGFDLTRASGDRLTVGAGLAIDSRGRVLLLSQEAALSIPRLIAEGERLASAATASSSAVAGAATSSASRRPGDAFGGCAPASTTAPAPASAATAPAELFLVSIAHAEDFCGQEDVYGTICEPACATTTERPYVVEGVVVLVTPLALPLPALPATDVIVGRLHLRSRVASAYFAEEARAVASLVSGAGLRGGLFCLGAPPSTGGSAVPLGVLSRSGAATVFLDEWIARRERLEAPARRAWAWRLAMRPWDVFLAQVLQFQCHLSGVLAGAVDPDLPPDPCVGAVGTAAGAIKDAYEHLSRIATALESVNLAAGVRSKLELARVNEWVGGYQELAQKLDEVGKTPVLSSRLLIQGGILELPSGGYLPVLPLSRLTVNEQVEAMMGEGVDLRFCVVRPDFVPHALEEAQHMERISLLAGLADPTRKPRVDILVPDGEFVTVGSTGPSKAFDAVWKSQGRLALEHASSDLQGLARAESLPAGGLALYFGGIGGGGDDTTKDPGVREMELRTVANASRKLSSARNAGRAGDEPTEVYARRADGIATKYVPADLTSRVQAMFLSFRCDADLFAPATAQTSYAVRLLTAIPSNHPRVLDLQVSGELIVRARDGGKVDGIVTVRGNVETPQSHPINSRSRFTIERAGTAAAATLTFTAPFVFEKERALARITVEWRAGRAAVSLQIVGGKGAEGSDRATAGGNDGVAIVDERLALREDPRALDPGNQRRVFATYALDVLDLVVDEDGFRANAERALFGDPQEVTERRLLRATRDWVMFHRRRDKDCGGQQPAPPVAARPRKYRVYYRAVDARAQLGPVRVALLRNDTAALIKLGFEEVAVADYAAASATITKLAFGAESQPTPAIAGAPGAPGSVAGAPAAPAAPAGGTASAGNIRVNSPPAAVGVGRRFELVYSAVGSSPETEAEGEALARDRLDALETALRSFVTPASDRLPSDVLAEVPSPALSASGADGVMVLVLQPRKVDPQPEPPPQTRQARLVFYKGDGNDRIDPGTEMVFELDAGGKPAAYTFKAALQRLLRSTGEGPISVELAIPGGGDAAADKRLEGVRAELESLRPGITSRRVRPSTPAEKTFLESPSKVDELVVIRI